MNRPIRVKGHSDPTQGAPHDALGRPLGLSTQRAGFGRARCACGALSVVLPSQMARQRWHRLHREVLAGVPWAS